MQNISLVDAGRLCLHNHVWHSMILFFGFSLFSIFEIRFIWARARNHDIEYPSESSNLFAHRHRPLLFVSWGHFYNRSLTLWSILSISSTSSSSRPTANRFIADWRDDQFIWEILIRYYDVTAHRNQQNIILCIERRKNKRQWGERERAATEEKKSRFRGGRSGSTF